MGKLLAVRSAVSVGLFGAALLLRTGGDGGSVARWRSFESKADGISLRYPAGWHAVRRNLTACTDPVQRLAISSSGDPDRGVLIILEERLESDDGLPPRPAHFVLAGKARSLECCTPTERPGYAVDFSEQGRGFYGYVYLGTANTRPPVVRTLDSLQVARLPSRGG